MFTGIIKDVGRITRVETRGRSSRLTVATRLFDDYEIRPGDSIAVNGVCLTVVRPEAGEFNADVSPETLTVTTLGGLETGAAVNLEPALRAADPLGGHIVSGHVDGVVSVSALGEIDDCLRVRFRLADGADLARYLARKGSVAIDGVSLTVNDADATGFEVMLVPHTLAATTFSTLAVGKDANIEIDLMARYAERILNA